MQNTPPKPSALTLVVILALATLAFASVLLSSSGVKAELSALYETSNGLAKLGLTIASIVGFLAFAIVPHISLRRSFSEYEFREVFGIRVEMAKTDTQIDKARLENGIRELLGEDRYQTYLIATDPVLRAVTKKTLSGSISDSEITDVISMVKELESAYIASNVEKIVEIGEELASTIGDSNASQIQVAIRARNNAGRAKTDTFISLN